MGLGRVVGLGLVGLLIYKQSDAIVSRIAGMKKMMPKAETLVQMNSFLSPLQAHLTNQVLEGENPRLPEDVSSWLTQNFNLSSGKPAGVDVFGTPYRGDEVKGWLCLRSCGPDKSCGNEDDIVVQVFKDQ
jgi:hypothetical protein